MVLHFIRRLYGCAIFLGKKIKTHKIVLAINGNNVVTLYLRIMMTNIIIGNNL